ncbi:Ethanolamine utilization protein [Serratia rubidaea]|uniref:DUF861 domain-containing protein n=1 Tax=Serratia rubidaea TaxID=61652 RepID=A0A3S4XAC1_SERRU|nr:MULTISPECIES: cupin domain-containing protein [Serratia]AGB80912.1 putative enzyme of the cupin superfamily [Serratia sp. FGI94]MBD8453326.1 DUF861 domain-containing protein [Serratia rubidaea]MBH1929904.1 DUF861 domain-containing protein [Serratia rubidaea]MBS0975763.1 DUF861 domain-containing protein [Serratia rubidaea]MDC6112489.1 cupin domain-containing protein [Serratia rubidaea]
MKPLLLKQPLPALTAIGSVSNLGATVIAGEPTVSVAMIHGAPDDNLSCGVFSCTRGSFVMEYPFAEHATVWEGTVTLTDEASGEAVQYQAGDAWFAPKGARVRWDITSDRFVKHYLAVVNG